MDLNFNANGIEDVADFELIPSGWYPAVIENTEQRECNDGVSKMMMVTFVIIDGQFKGRKLWTNLNLWHKSEKATEFAKRTLATIVRAQGKSVIGNSSELHNVPMGIKVKAEKRNDTGEMHNSIAAYCSERDIAGKAGSASAPFTAAPSANNQPWASK